MMRVGVPREVVAGERRVALVPDVAARLIRGGLGVVVEAGAGAAAGFPNEAWVGAGATVVPDAAALWGGVDVVVKVQPPTPAEVALLREGAAIIAFLSPLTEPTLVRSLADARATAFAMELVPRITRAQSMDALSSQATAAGYKAVLHAAELSPKFFPMLTTAAGTIAPAKVLILGAGVAGLQAIATARRLGAVVEAFDIRPAVKEQVESLGAKFVGLTFEGAETAGGYAAELDAEQQDRQREMLSRHIAGSDVVITTAQVPGRRAPVLIAEPMVEAMRPGSVIVDLAGESGGNCELTRCGETIVRHGVTIAAPVNLPATIPLHASQMYARNIATLLGHLVRDGALVVDPEDEITAGCCVTHDGAIVHPRVREVAAAAR